MKESLFMHHEEHKDHKNKVMYVCEGTCGGKVTEEEFQQGKNLCMTEGCPNHGKPLVRKEVCEDCEEKENSGHSCPNC